MSISVQWDTAEKHALCCTLMGNWSWLELRRKVRLTFALMRSVDYSVDIIVDLTQSTCKPANPVEHATSLLPYLPANCGTIVLVHPQTFQIQELSTIYKLYRKQSQHTILAEGVEQARELLAYERHMQMTCARRFNRT